MQEGAVSYQKALFSLASLIYSLTHKLTHLPTCSLSLQHSSLLCSIVVSTSSCTATISSLHLVLVFVDSSGGRNTSQ